VNVTLPSGKVIQGIPEGTPKDVIMQKAIAAGLANEQDFGIQEEVDPNLLQLQDMLVRQSKGEQGLEQPIEDLRQLTGQPDSGKTFGSGGIVPKLEATASMLSGMAAQPIAGVAGLITAKDPFSPEGSAGTTVRNVQEALTYQPRTEKGKEFQQAIGEAVKPIAEPLQKAEDFLGDTTFEATGSPGLAAAAKSAPTAMLEVLGIKSGKILKGAKDGVKKLVAPSPTKKKIIESLQAGTGDASTAKFKLKESILTGAPKLKKDKVAIEAIKQGFDEGVIASVKGSSKADKAKMLQMVEVMEKGKNNAKFAIENRSSNIAGDSLMDRFKAVRNVNKKAGSELDSIARSLAGNKVDNTSVIAKFSKTLDDMGVSFDASRNPIFKGSDVEGLGASMKAIKQIINRLKSVRSSDAYQMHRLKRFIDENVTYGKSGEGLKGAAERALKSLRKNVDAKLDQKFPAYDKVNQKYADTIDALNSFQDVAGKKMDLSAGSADKATGTLLRRLMGNAQSRVRLLDAVNNVENTAKKYGSKFDDDLLTQVLFVDELDTVFGPVARTSFQGQIKQALPTSKQDVAMRAVESIAKKVKGIDQESAFKAIKKLLGKKD